MPTRIRIKREGLLRWGLFIMKDLGDWLKALGLEQYAERFAANDVDFEVLAHLSDDDLKEIGLTMGHRRKLQAALADGLSFGEQALSPDQRSSPKAVSTPGGEAERRQLTVMLCDLVGSTALSQDLDPEDLRALMTDYQDVCTSAIKSFEGYVARYMGDGLLAYFGYPQAHEDDAERAVNAGLALVNEVNALERGLEVRVGIATGPVVVGDMIGEGASQEAAVTGETPNLAARLQEIAAPGQIVIAPGTHRLAQHAFDCIEMATQELKGLEAPVVPWRVAGARKVDSRFEAARGSKLTDLMGREDEVDLLLRRWDGVKSGEAQIVLLSGEAGIGKSRLTQALRERISEQRYTHIHFQCSPFFSNRALHPVIQHLERAAGFASGDSGQQKAEKLEAMTRLATDDVEPVLPWIAALLSVQVDDRYAVPEVSPPMRKNRTHEALYAQLVGLAERDPVLLILEDAHWIDNTTLELMQMLVDRLESEAILAVMTFRPEFNTSWIGEPRVTSLALNRLGRLQSTAMVESIAGKTLSREIVEEIVYRADGVPLFVEELATTVVASEKSESTGEVPETLQGALMARLDQMGAAKDLVQIASVIGRQFGHALLAVVAGQSELELAQNLEQLVRSGLVQARGTPPDVNYLFRHALLCDTAYDSLLRTQRQDLHGRIASAVEEHFSETAPPEILAHHLTEASEVERAIPYWHEAGRLALRRSANVEALNQLNTAIDHLHTLENSQQRAKHELEILFDIGTAYLAAKGYGSTEVKDTYERAKSLAERVGDHSLTFRAIFGLWLYNMQKPPLDRSTELAGEMRGIADQSQSSDHDLQAHHAAWTLNWMDGDLQAALAHTQEGERIYDVQDHASHALIYGGHDPGMCARNIAAYALWTLGYPEQARAKSIEAAGIVNETGHKFSVTQALIMNSNISLLMGDALIAEETVRKGIDLATELGFQTKGPAEMSSGLLELRPGIDRARLHQLRDQAMTPSPAGFDVFRPYWLGILAEFFAGSGLYEDATEMLAEARQLANLYRTHWTLPEVMRQTAELSRATGADHRDVEKGLIEAIETAQEQSAKSWELRAAPSLAQLKRDHGKPDEGRRILAPVYDWFTEGFDTADLKKAKTLLEEIA